VATLEKYLFRSLYTTKNALLSTDKGAFFE